MSGLGLGGAIFKTLASGHLKGVEHLLFGTDFPFAGHNGERVTRQTINAIEKMDISDLEKKKIFEDNARVLMRLPI
jgi:predicted TIM-barrel fold metal-dependent hydrolase